MLKPAVRVAQPHQQAATAQLVVPTLLTGAWWQDKRQWAPTETHETTEDKKTFLLQERSNTPIGCPERFWRPDSITGLHAYSQYY